MANINSNKVAADQNRESYADDAKARRVLLVDGNSTVTPGESVGTDVDTVRGLLSDISNSLKSTVEQLKIINIHLSQISGLNIDTLDEEE